MLRSIAKGCPRGTPQTILRYTLAESIDRSTAAVHSNTAIDWLEHSLAWRRCEFSRDGLQGRTRVGLSVPLLSTMSPIRLLLEQLCCDVVFRVDVADARPAALVRHNILDAAESRIGGLEHSTAPCCHRHGIPATHASDPRLPHFSYPTRRGLPHGEVSHTARYPSFPHTHTARCVPQGAARRHGG